MNKINKTINFFKEVKVEMKKVTWPTRKETIKYTFVVIGISIALALFLGAFDFVFSFFIQQFI